MRAFARHGASFFFFSFSLCLPFAAAPPAPCVAAAASAPSHPPPELELAARERAHDAQLPSHLRSPLWQSDVLETVGTTPLVKLRHMSPSPHVELWVKMEMLNPSGAVKDRIVRHIIQDAEQRGLLKPGGTIVENTSGNTGAAVAMIAAAKGYRAILTLPDKVSIEKQNALRAYGAEVVVCPTSVPPGSPEHYEEKCHAIHKSIPGAFKVSPVRA